MYPFLIIILFSFCVANLTSTQRIDYLPGFQGPLPFHLETGYVGVDVNEDVQLFYYFIPSESYPKDDPVILWLTGGRGCSSITTLFFQIGPIQFEAVSYNGSFPNLILRPNSWTKVASIIFLELPVGTGFSYARTTSASHSNDILYAEHAHEFMKKWLESHPEFNSNPFYIGGISYSGAIVPIVVQLISKGNEISTKPFINIKGYLLANPKTFPDEGNYRIRFANGMGLISDELYKSLFHGCHGEYRSEYIDPYNIECLRNLNLYEECIDGIKKQNVLEPYCQSTIELPSQMWSKEGSLLSSFYCRFYEGLRPYYLGYYWANDANVREALHIRKGSIGEWIECNVNLNFTTTVDDVRPYHLNLSNKGYRSLIYSGDHDMFVPHHSTHAWIKNLNYSVVDRWRSWKVEGQIAGYIESYSNGMTFATVKASNEGVIDLLFCVFINIVNRKGSDPYTTIFLQTQCALKRCGAFGFGEQAQRMFYNVQEMDSPSTAVSHHSIINKMLKR